MFVKYGVCDFCFLFCGALFAAQEFLALEKICQRPAPWNFFATREPNEIKFQSWVMTPCRCWSKRRKKTKTKKAGGQCSSITNNSWNFQGCPHMWTKSPRRCWGTSTILQWRRNGFTNVYNSSIDTIGISIRVSENLVRHTILVWGSNK